MRKYILTSAVAPILETPNPWPETARGSCPCGTGGATQLFRRHQCNKQSELQRTHHKQ